MAQLFSILSIFVIGLMIIEVRVVRSLNIEPSYFSQAQKLSMHAVNNLDVPINECLVDKIVHKIESNYRTFASRRLH